MKAGAFSTNAQLPSTWAALLLGVACVALALVGARALRNQEAAESRELASLSARVASDLPRRIDQALDQDAIPPAAESAPRCVLGLRMTNDVRPKADASLLREADSPRACTLAAADLPNAPADKRAELARILENDAACARVRGESGYPIVPALLAQHGESAKLEAWIVRERAHLGPGDRGFLRTSIEDAPIDETAKRNLRGRLAELAAPHEAIDTAMRTLAESARELPGAPHTLRTDTSEARLVRRGSESFVSVLDTGELLRCGAERLSIPSDLTLRKIDANEKDAPTRVRLAPLLLLEVGPKGPEVLARRTRESRLLLGTLFGATLLGATALGIASVVRARKMQRLAELRTDFAAAIAHELRTPLTSMRILTELLAEGNLPEKEREDASRTLAEQTERLATTAERMLSLRALMLGARSAELVPTDLTALAEQAASEFETRTGTKPRSIARTWSDVGPALADPVLVRMILDNYLENARKYAGGPTEITIEHSGHAIVLAVRDRGPGVPEVDRARLFRPFERGRGRLTDAREGAGLGLALVRYAADAMNAKVGVTQESQGASFFLEIESHVAPKTP